MESKMRLLSLFVLLGCRSGKMNSEPGSDVVLEDQDGDGFSSDEDCDDEKSSKYVDEECRTKIIVPNPGIAEVPKPAIPINPFKNMSDEEIENMKNKMKNTIDNLPPAEMHSLFDIPLYGIDDKRQLIISEIIEYW